MAKDNIPNMIFTAWQEIYTGDCLELREGNIIVSSKDELYLFLSKHKLKYRWNEYYSEFNMSKETFFSLKSIRRNL